jgi:cyclophilin family peptidyl-prolyl cis-trans isomerase
MAEDIRSRKYPDPRSQDRSRLHRAEARYRARACQARQELTRRGFYDGVVFHRVIPGFMAQTGDPTGTGAGGSDLPNLKAEFSDTSHKRGTVSAARTANPNSANSQFFICFDDAPWLDRQYSVWGEVTSGMEHVDAIKKGRRTQ